MVVNSLSQMFKALGDPTRLRIFEFLANRCCPVALEETGEVHPIRGTTVGDVCCHVTGSEKFSSTVSFHLKELRLAGLISAEKSGKYVVCGVRTEAIDALNRFFNQLPMPDLSGCDPALYQQENQ